MEFTVEETDTTAIAISLPFLRRRDWEQWVLLRSDGHIDNPKTDNKLAFRHLQQAIDRNAIICDFGDLICGMQGRDDRRGSKNDIRPENQTSDYLGSLIKTGVDYFSPYKDNLAVIGTGNHESAILKRSELDLTSAIVDRLRDKGSKVILGGYRGWIRFKFKQQNGNQRQGVNLHYTHGGGGGGPVTKGVINTNRRAVYLPDAHIVVGGHIHEAWQLEIVRSRLSEQGREYADEQLHICMPTYKEEFIGIKGGFHHEKEGPPKPLGAQWLRFYYDYPSERIKYECIRAK